jgi:hypothetical protein
MISRMILVGLVAVLGVSLPSRSEPTNWWTSARVWVTTQLAEWDADTPGEDFCLIVTEAPDSPPREAIRAAARTNTPASVAFEPIPVDDELDTGLADELNRMAEGLEVPATTTAVADSPTDFLAVSPSDSIELKLAVELCRIAEGSARDETLSAPAIPQPRDTDAGPAIDEIFADVSQVFAPPEPGLATIAARPTFEPIPTPVDLETDIAAELNRFAEGIEIHPEGAPARLVRIGTFEPIKVPADLEPGIAYELNRASEGLEIVAPEVRTLGAARPRISGSEPAVHLEGNPGDASIGKALGLTRDAALAWMNVLTGMTPVTMTSR